MKHFFTFLLSFFLGSTAFSQWFNDDMGSTSFGSAPCPWVYNANPRVGVTNNGICATPVAPATGATIWQAGYAGVPNTTNSSGASYVWQFSSVGGDCKFLIPII